MNPVNAPPERTQKEPRQGRRSRSGGHRAGPQEFAGWLLFVAIIIAAWSTVGPTAIGGPANYVVVDGRSMEPTYADGDLVIVRESDSYEVGDVVAYLPDIGQHFPVIHRIVTTTKQGEFVTQGDNRRGPDGWHATNQNIFGRSWIHIPHGGKMILLIREPTTWLALAAAMIALAVTSWVEGRNPSPRRKRGRHLRTYSPTPISLFMLMVPALLAITAATADAAGLAVDGGVLQDLGVSPPADVDDPDKMIWVCKVVGHPEQPRLIGEDPLYVSVHSRDGREAFSDEHPSYVVEEGDRCLGPVGDEADTADEPHSDTGTEGGGSNAPPGTAPRPETSTTLEDTTPTEGTTTTTTTLADTTTTATTTTTPDDTTTSTEVQEGT